MWASALRRCMRVWVVPPLITPAQAAEQIRPPPAAAAAAAAAATAAAGGGLASSIPQSPRPFAASPKPSSDRIEQTHSLTTTSLSAWPVLLWHFDEAVLPPSFPPSSPPFPISSSSLISKKKENQRLLRNLFHVLPDDVLTNLGPSLYMSAVRQNLVSPWGGWREGLAGGSNRRVLLVDLHGHSVRLALFGALPFVWEKIDGRKEGGREGGGITHVVTGHGRGRERREGGIGWKKEGERRRKRGGEKEAIFSCPLASPSSSSSFPPSSSSSVLYSAVFNWISEAVKKDEDGGREGGREGSVVWKESKGCVGVRMGAVRDRR